MATGDLVLAVSNALAGLWKAIQDAIALRQNNPVAPAALMSAAINKIAASVSVLNSAVAALNAAGVATSVQDAQIVAFNTAVESALDLWQKTINQLRQAGVKGI